MALSSSTDSRTHAPAQVMSIKMSSFPGDITGLSRQYACSTVHKTLGHNQGFSQHYRLSTWHFGFMTAWYSSMKHSHQHILQWHHEPWWSFEEVQYRKWTSLQFLIEGLHCCSIARVIHSHIQGTSSASASTLGCCRPSCQTYYYTVDPSPLPCLSPLSHSCSPSLNTTGTALFFIVSTSTVQTWLSCCCPSWEAG